jgi:hypothetical protein
MRLFLRDKGRPKNRWEDDVMKDVKLLKIKKTWSKAFKIERIGEGQNFQRKKL